MVFSSTFFLFVFLPAVLIAYYIPFIKSRTYKNYILLLASLFFYAWGEPAFVFLMLISIVVTWLCGRYMTGNKRKLFLILGVSWLLGLMLVFKYLTFILSQVGLLIGKDIAVSIALPIGISFFTFQMMSYLFDVYYHTAEPQKKLSGVALYAVLFPQLIAGPIVRYSDVAKAINDRHETWDKFCDGVVRFIYGLGKKVLLANFLAQIADNVFDFMPEKTLLMAWIGIIAYALQIYFDFSGYSDMAIGLGKMFGFDFLENFNYPYIAGSVTDFWRRWHMSLSSWFRDYVYIPLGGNRCSKSRWVLNLFIVWLLTGIWHGANWTFILWGLFYFVVLLAEKLSGLAKKQNVFTHTYTILAVLLAWVLFRAPDVASAFSYMGNMFGIGVSGLADSLSVRYLLAGLPVILTGIVAATPLYKNGILKLKDTKAASIEYMFVFIILVLSVVQVITATYNPFIYYNF